jgi:hypothetical protein
MKASETGLKSQQQQKTPVANLVRNAASELTMPEPESAAS